MNPLAKELIARTAAFSKMIIELCERLPRTDAGRTISLQLVEAATSVASNYRATCRARSKREFVSKIGQVVEEADESLGWLEMIVDNRLLDREVTAAALKEANELTAIFSASLRTAKQRLAIEKQRRVAALNRRRQ